MTRHDDPGTPAEPATADAASAGEPTVAGPQSEAAVVPIEAAAAAAYAMPMPSVLSAEQRRLLAAVLDRIVPPRAGPDGDAGLAGAGCLGVGAAIERTLAMTPGLRRLLLDGLTTIDVTAARQTGRDFLALDAAAQEDVLRAVETAEPDFFAALVEHTYRGYYVRPDVHAAIGYPARPPQPLGYVLQPFRDDLLTTQRGRAPFWRRAAPE